MQEMPETKIVHEKLVSQLGVTSIAHSVILRVVIVGAAFGGLHAALALRNVPVQVTNLLPAPVTRALPWKFEEEER